MNMYQAEGQTVLHIASQNGDENMIRTLYLARANATITDEEGKAQFQQFRARLGTCRT